MLKQYQKVQLYCEHDSETTSICSQQQKNCISVLQNVQHAWSSHFLLVRIFLCDKRSQANTAVESRPGASLSLVHFLLQISTFIQQHAFIDVHIPLLGEIYSKKSNWQTKFAPFVICHSHSRLREHSSEMLFLCFFFGKAVHGCCCESWFTFLSSLLLSQLQKQSCHEAGNDGQDSSGDETCWWPAIVICKVNTCFNSLFLSLCDCWGPLACSCWQLEQCSDFRCFYEPLFVYLFPVSYTCPGKLPGRRQMIIYDFLLPPCT